eukprot:TRINITY_DN361_c0_g1_i1.p1 TRINITY_DN361_c0_g1~~TRINITY_DN361_c0_g1_i1.p1  ORF type:complete len:647 (+),score=137.51 TRINITY_DN361_c0_g1_i1:191-2131(+)
MYGPNSHPPRSLLSARVTEHLENVKTEFETLAHDANVFKMQRDDYERQLQAQLGEFTNIQQALFELDRNHTKMKQQYEDEIMRLRRQVELQGGGSLPQSSLPPFGNSPTIPTPSPVRPVTGNDKGPSFPYPGGPSGLPPIDPKRSYSSNHPSAPASSPGPNGLPPGGSNPPRIPSSSDHSLPPKRPRDPEFYAPPGTSNLTLPPTRDTFPPMNSEAPQKLKQPAGGDTNSEEKDAKHKRFMESPLKPPTTSPAPSASVGPNTVNLTSLSSTSSTVPTIPTGNISNSFNPDEQLPVKPTPPPPAPSSRSDSETTTPTTTTAGGAGPDWIVGCNPAVTTNLNMDLLHSLDHTSVVCCVRFSQDGKYMATGCNKSAQIYDVSSGEKVHTFAEDLNKEGDLYMRSVCFSPDGKYLAAGAEDKTVKLWDIETKQLHHTFVGHDLDIYSLDFSKDGKLIVSGSGDKKAKIWDVTKGECMFTLGQDDVGPKDGVTSVAFSPDGRLVATGSLDRIVRLWDATTGYFLERYEGHVDSVYSVAFSPDGKYLASGSLDKTLKLWDFTGGSSRPRSRCRSTFTGHKDFVLSVAFSPDGNWLISGSKDRSVQFWDPRTAVTHLMLQGHKNSVISVSVSPAGGVFATGSGDFRARCWKYE